MRAGFGETVRLAVGLSAGQIDIGDLGDNVARAVNLDPVALANVAALADRRAVAVAPGDVILVVQGGIRHHHSAHRHRFQPRDGGQRAGAANLDVDPVQSRPGGFGGKLVGKRPSRRGRTVSETGLIGQVVDLVDHPVDVIAQRCALLFDICPDRQHLFRVMAQARQRVRLEAKRRKPIDSALLRRGQRFADLPPAIGEEPQGARGGHVRVDLAQRSGGGVAGIGKNPAPFGCVQAFEIGMAHVDFAPDLKNGGGASQAVGNVGNGASVGGDVFTHRAVAARCGLNQHAVLVSQGQGQAVDLGFGGKGQIAVAQTQKAADARHEIRHILGVEAVFQRHHPLRVRDLAETFGRRGPDRLRRAVRPRKLRKGAFQRQQPLFQCVIFRIRQDRGILEVIILVRLGDLGGQVGNFIARALFVKRGRIRSRRYAVILPCIRHRCLRLPSVCSIRRSAKGFTGAAARILRQPPGQAPIARRSALGAGSRRT